MKDIGPIDKLLRTRRKSVALEVNERAEVVVRAPKWVSQKFIIDFVYKHADWIDTQKKALAKRGVRTKKFVDGETFWYVGELFPLYITNARTSLLLKEGRFHMPNVSDPKSIFETWYKKQAKSIIVPRVQEIASQHGLSYGNVRITSAETRWGSCSAKKNLNFSWRLILLPQHVIDYVICHELAHLRHMNHSKNFWKEVQKLCPHYLSAKNELDKKKYVW